MSMKTLAGKTVETTVKFVGSDLKMAKLSAANVMAIREMSSEVQATAAANMKANAILIESGQQPIDYGKQDETDGLRLLRLVIDCSIEGATDLTDEEFKAFPMEELTKLSEAIMKFSGVETAKEQNAKK